MYFVLSEALPRCTYTAYTDIASARPETAVETDTGNPSVSLAAASSPYTGEP